MFGASEVQMNHKATKQQRNKENERKKKNERERERERKQAHKKKATNMHWKVQAGGLTWKQVSSWANRLPALRQVIKTCTTTLH